MLSNTTLTVKRRSAAGAHVTGRWVPGGTEDTLTMEASWQPANPTTLQALPEGQQSIKSFEIFTEAPLQMASEGFTPDRVSSPICPGELYDITFCRPWADDFVGHYHSLAQLVQTA